STVVVGDAPRDRLAHLRRRASAALLRAQPPVSAERRGIPERRESHRVQPVPCLLLGETRSAAGGHETCCLECADTHRTRVVRGPPPRRQPGDGGLQADHLIPCPPPRSPSE